jgi:hypothetical protein
MQYGASPMSPLEEDDDRTAPGIAPVEAPSSGENLASGESGLLRYVADRSDYAVFTVDMVEELRRKLRDAERREASGVRERPTPEPRVDTLADLEELEEIVSPLPEIEIALAPQSENNFYAGFDDAHPDGVFLATYDRLPVGAPAYVTLLLPGGYRFRTPAIVEWTREPEAEAHGLPTGIGLKMCGLDHRMRRMILGFVRHRRPIFYVG